VTTGATPTEIENRGIGFLERTGDIALRLAEEEVKEGELDAARCAEDYTRKGRGKGRGGDLLSYIPRPRCEGDDATTSSISNRGRKVRKKTVYQPPPVRRREIVGEPPVQKSVLRPFRGGGRVSGSY